MLQLMNNDRLNHNAAGGIQSNSNSSCIPLRKMNPKLREVQDQTANILSSKELMVHHNYNCAQVYNTGNINDKISMEISYS